MDSSASLHQVLLQAASADPTERRNAEEQLRVWETTPMFHMALLNVFLDSGQSSSQQQSTLIKIRSIAIILLKNGVIKYWRKSSHGRIGDEERLAIRQRLFSLLNEPNRQLAVQLCVVCGQIARIDFPREWPDVFPVLVQIVQSHFSNGLIDTPNDHSQSNSLYCLHMVVKQLCSKTLPDSRRSLQQFAPQLFQFVASILYSHTDAFLNSVSSLNDSIVHKLSISRIALKCLRRLVVRGFPDFAPVPAVSEFIQSLVRYLKAFLEVRSATLAYPNATSVVNAMIVLIGKTFVDLEEFKLVDFLLLPDSIAAVSFYYSILKSVSAATANDATMERLAVQSLRLLKNIIKNPEFNVISKRDADPRIVQVVHRLESELLTPEFVAELAKLLIGQYLCQSEEDLNAWEDDPEAYVQEEEADHWEYMLRACAEKLLMDLVSKNRAILCPIIMEMLHHVLVEPAHQYSLLKDAVYSAVGLAANDLFDYMDFADFFRSRLVQESQTTDDDSKVIRRRISWLIGRWVGVKAPADLRPQLFHVLIHLLRPTEDMVVKLTAVNDIRICVDDFDFTADSFQPFLAQSIPLFMELLGRVDEFESKMKILNCIIVIIERMETQILPFVEPVIQIIPGLWNQSDGQNVFRALMVTMLSKLIKALRGESTQLHTMVMPILQNSLDVTQPGHIFLLEEGLLLLVAVVQNANVCTPHLVQLVPLVTSLLEYGTESLKRVLHIIEGYILLDAKATLQQNAIPIMAAIAEMLGSLKPQASNALLGCLDTTLQACHNQQCFSAISSVICEGSVLMKALQVILQSEEVSFIKAGYLNILSRMVLYDPLPLLHKLHDLGASMQPPDADLLGHLLDTWIGKVEAMGHVKQRKLTALSFCRLLALGNESVMKRAPQIVAVVTNILAELETLKDDESLHITFHTREEDEDDGSLEAERWKQLQSLDPVFQNGSLKQYYSACLHEIEQKIGTTSYQQFLAFVDLNH